jgi:hypothetical protein
VVATDDVSLTVRAMPILRMHMYGQGICIYSAPTADDRDTRLPTMQHVALEGRCYVLTAWQPPRRVSPNRRYRSNTARWRRWLRGCAGRW